MQMEFHSTERGADRAGPSRPRKQNREWEDDSGESHDTQAGDAQTTPPTTGTPDTRSKYERALALLADRQRAYEDAVNQGRADAPELGQRAHASRRLVDLMERDMKRNTIRNGLDTFSLHTYETAFTNNFDLPPSSDNELRAASNKNTALTAMAVDHVDTKLSTQLGTAQSPVQSQLRQKRQELMNVDRNACTAIRQFQGDVSGSETPGPSQGGSAPGGAQPQGGSLFDVLLGGAGSSGLRIRTSRPSPSQEGATLTDAQIRELRSAIMSSERDMFDILARYTNSMNNAFVVRSAMSDLPSNELSNNRIMSHMSFKDYMRFQTGNQPDFDSWFEKLMNGDLPIQLKQDGRIPQASEFTLSL